MNKSAIIIIILALVLVIIAGFMLLDNDSTGEITTQDEESDLDSVADSEFTDLDTNDDVLNEIDSALDNLE